MILGFWRKTHINYVLKIVKKNTCNITCEGVYYSIDREKVKKSFQKEFSKKVENKT
jgi:hypothetical protein